MQFIQNTGHTFTRLFRYMNQLSTRAVRILIAIAAIVAVILVFALQEDAENIPQTEGVRSVALASVSALSSNSEPLALIGEVVSVSEASIRAEAGGRVTGTYAERGDFVNAGYVLAKTENSAQSAAVLQAEGALESAEAQLAKLRSGARDEEIRIAEIAVLNAKNAYEQSRVSTTNTIRSVYNSNDDIVHTKIDVMFSNPTSPVPQFIPRGTNSALEVQIENMRLTIEVILNNQQARSERLDEQTNLEEEINRLQDETQLIREFVALIATVLNSVNPSMEMSQSEIDLYISTASAARTAAGTSLATLSSAAQNLHATEAALLTAETQLEQTQSGARSEDIAAASASVKQAQGAYNAALAALEKTHIRTPISGTLNSFSISTGDYLTPQQEVAVVANNNALEVQTYITEHDRGIIVGNTALIEGRYPGVVTKVAEALDPLTRKIEVRIALRDDVAALANGQSVRVALNRASRETQTTTTSNEPLTIPLSSVKIEAGRNVVFTLSPEGTLVAHPIELGALLGESIQVLSGLTPEMQIVVDARGLREGESVIVE